MSRRDGDWDGMPEDPLDDAVQQYVALFGQGPPVWPFLGRPQELVREILAAVRRGQPVTEAELYRRFGMKPPPPDAVL